MSEAYLTAPSPTVKPTKPNKPSACYGPLGTDTASPAPRKRANQHGRLGVDGGAEDVRCQGGCAVGLLEVLKDGAGLFHSFWGRFLATRRRRKPKSLSLVATVRSHGS